jgi:hypothetical protein
MYGSFPQSNHNYNYPNSCFLRPFSLYRTFRVTQVSKTLPVVTEPEYSLCSKEPLVNHIIQTTHLHTHTYTHTHTHTHTHISLRSILILLLHLRFSLPYSLFPLGFPSKMVYAFVSSLCVLHIPPFSSSFI